MPDIEIEAMGKVADALSDLEDEVRGRVLRWAADRYAVKLPGSRDRKDENASDGEQGVGNGNNSDAPVDDEGPKLQSFEHFAELYDAVGPSTDPERALTAAYWTQVLLGKSPFGSQELNVLLKNLGHGVGAINKAMISNMGKRPALMLQVGRGGNAQQARKKYKVTEAGIRWVKARLD